MAQAQLRTTSSTSSCGKTVDDLVNKVIDLGGAPATVGLGRDMGMEAAYGKYTKGNLDPNPLPVDGFKRNLIDNAQGADVYKHIYGIAGAVLIGESYVISKYWPFSVPGRARMTGSEVAKAQIADDRTAAAGGRTESETELRDDEAGLDVGFAMLKAAKEPTSPKVLGRTLFDILCDF